MLRPLLATALSVAVAIPVLAQDNGGRRLVLDFGQSLEATRNPDLEAGSDDTVTSAVTSLGLTLSSITRSESLTFGLGTSFRLQSDEDPDFGQLDARLSYGRTGPSSSVELSARYGRDDIEALRPIELLVLDTGEVVDVEDLDALLRETGTRETLTLRAALAFGTDAPLGGRVTVEASQLRYSGLSSAVDLSDRDSLRLGLDLDAQVAPATVATLSFGHGWSEETGEDRLFTSSLGASVTFERPTADLTFGVTVTEAEAGTRVTLSGGIAQELANGGELSLSLGATRTADEETVLSGRGRYAVPLSPTTGLAARFERSVADRSGGTEEVRTVTGLDLTQELTPISSLAFSFAAVDRRTPGGDDARLDAEATASYRHQLTEDWGLGLGLTRSFRDDAGAGDSATSDTVFLSLSRSFERRF